MTKIDLAPTAYEVERQKQLKQTPKQRLNEGKKQFKKAVASYALATKNSTTGMQLVKLKHVESVAEKYGIELDVYFKWMLALHCVMEPG